MAKTIDGGFLPADHPLFKSWFVFSVSGYKKPTSAVPKNADGTEAKPSSQADKEEDKR